MSEKPSGVLPIETDIEKLGENNIEFSGFTQEQREWLVDLLNSFGFSYTRIKRFSYESDLKTPDANGDSMYGFNHARLAEYSFVDQEIRINKKALENIKPGRRAYALRVILAHEISHSFSIIKAAREKTWDEEVRGPIEEKKRGYAAQYKEPEKIVNLANQIKQASSQLVKTDVSLSPYHAGLVDRFQELGTRATEGALSEEKFKGSSLILADEVHAILVEQLFRNPRHLTQVDNACRKKYQKLSDPKPTYVSIVDTAYMVIGSVTGGSREDTDGSVRRSKKLIRNAPF